MKLHYDPETDSLSIALNDAPGSQTREIVEELVADLDAARQCRRPRHRSCVKEARSFQDRDDCTSPDICGGVGRAVTCSPDERSDPWAMISCPGFRFAYPGYARWSTLELKLWGAGCRVTGVGTETIRTGLSRRGLLLTHC